MADDWHQLQLEELESVAAILNPHEFASVLSRAWNGASQAKTQQKNKQLIEILNARFRSPSSPPAADDGQPMGGQMTIAPAVRAEGVQLLLPQALAEKVGQTGPAKNSLERVKQQKRNIRSAWPAAAPPAEQPACALPVYTTDSLVGPSVLILFSASCLTPPNRSTPACRRPPQRPPANRHTPCTICRPSC